MTKSLYKYWVLLLAILAPTALLAQQRTGGALSFAPPPGDSSVVFLGDIFGVVDGVLHGSGSMLMGTMFGVFNAAVMALGGIVIMYTLMVSTMNTAQEGQMLGQKWSSIWIPLRSTVGLALLVPKASGYCMMQIFVMWVVMQGVGAADKIWNATLDYLKQGGAIVRAQQDPTTSLFAGNGSVASGATVMLAGQVCMQGVEQTLRKQRESYMQFKQKGAGPCAGSPDGPMKAFCDTPVPDFASTFNAVASQSGNIANVYLQKEFSVPMPNFSSASPYSTLNGICGQVTWDNFLQTAVSGLMPEIQSKLTDETPSEQIETIRDAMIKTGMNTGDIQTIVMSRAIAVQQMYTSLSSVARRIVSNIPGLDTTGVGPDQNVSDVAARPFGVPYNSAGMPCKSSETDCTGWGVGPGTTAQAPLFSGTEYQGAISDYNTVISPALTLIAESKNKHEEDRSRHFIERARQQGWIMAGSYFFDLVRLNQDASVGSTTTDASSGLKASNFDAKNLNSPFGSDHTCAGNYADLCHWLGGNESNIQKVISVIDGSNILQSPLDQPSLGQVSSPQPPIYDDPAASTVYGFIDNSVKVKLPGQPGLTGPTFSMKISAPSKTNQFQLQKMHHFPCGHMGLLGCAGRKVSKALYNDVFVNVVNVLLGTVAQELEKLIQLFLIIPLMGMAHIFKNGVNYITQTGADPIVALANMGVHYINFANQIWIDIIIVTVFTALIPLAGDAVFALIMLALPLFMAWMGVMLAVGFICAYYIPFVPYMIFTFGSIAWLMAVIEAMVAAPIVALGVTHPEGNEAFGKGEQAIMIIFNVFLRPSMMVIGFFAAIILSYVAVWILNEGFQNASNFIQGGIHSATLAIYKEPSSMSANTSGVHTQSGYSGWAGIYAFFFTLLMYTTLYTIVVQKSFTLITVLPDRVLRWIGGQPESIGGETAQWGEEAKGQVKDAGGATSKASQAMDQQLAGKAASGIDSIKKSVGGGGSSASASIDKGISATGGMPE